MRCNGRLGSALFLGSKAVIFLLGFVLTAGTVAAKDGTEKDDSEFESHIFSVPGGAKLPYRLLRPAGQDKTRKYPVVLVLHGWGQRGTDNQKQLSYFDRVFIDPVNRERFPCFVLVPQANGSWIANPTFDKPIPLTKQPTASLAMAVELVAMLSKKSPVDMDRVYLMGISNAPAACGRSWSARRTPGRPRCSWPARAIQGR